MKPANNAERLDFAQVAYAVKRFAVAAGLWAEALETDPNLGDDRKTLDRYNAARAAALAAAGHGEDEPLDDAAKAKLRGQALDWLKAEFTAWGKTQPRPAIEQTLWRWQLDTALAGIRDEAALAKLSPEEQKAFSQFWAEVAKTAEPNDDAERLAFVHILCDRLMDADEKQFAILVPRLKEYGAQGLVVLTREIDKTLPPDAKDDAKEKLAKQQANAAVALLRMNRPEKVWPLLKHSPDPRLRSYLIHRLGPLGADAAAVVKQLDKESDLTTRRALVLSLGEFSEKDFPPDDRKAVMPKLQEMYRTAADPGLHAASEWLLRQWKHEAWLAEINQAWAADKQQQLKRLEEIMQELKKQGKEERRWYVNGQGQTLVVVPGPVEFWMGSPPTETDRRDNEAKHWQRIGRSFAIASKEVTVEQFLHFRKDHAIDGKAAPSSDCPVNMVTWYDAAAYCNWLSEQEGMPQEQWCYEPNKDGMYAEGMKLAANYLQRTGYRLPTEAEWEFASRAGAMTSRHYGESDELLPRYAWYLTNSQNKSWPVGRLKPNDLGLFDVLGNHWEWCQEVFNMYRIGGDGKRTEDIEDAADITNGQQRVLRGGCFADLPLDSRSAARGLGGPTYRYTYSGFRPARTLPFSTLDRYAAARAAALAAAGQNKDQPPLDDAAKAKLRRQALGWLKAELAAWGKLLDSAPPEVIVPTLSQWRKDADLAGIRDKEALAKLPAAEQKDWQALWAEVDAALRFRLPKTGLQSWMAQDRDGKLLAVPNNDTVVIFDARTGELVHTLTEVTHRMYAVAFSPDGKFLAGANWIGGWDDEANTSSIKVWELKTGKVAAGLTSSVGWTWSLAFSPDGKQLLAGGDRGLEVWDLSTGKAVQSFAGGFLWQLGLSPDGKKVAYPESKTVRVCNPVSGERVGTLEGFAEVVRATAFAPDGKLLATGSDRELLLWDADTLTLVKKIATPAGWVAFEPGGKALLTARHDQNGPNRDHVVTRWDLATYKGTPLPSLTGRAGWTVFQLSPDGTTLYSLVVDGQDSDRCVRAYDLVALSKRHPAIMRGEEKPADNAERLRVARFAYDQKKFAAATRLWAEALETDPKLGDDRRTLYRYNAARAAVLAAAGQGKDEPPLDDAGQAKLRRQALDWLKSELTAWTTLRESGAPQGRLTIALALSDWQQEPDLAGIRETKALARLSRFEQTEWQTHWAEAAALRRQFASLPAAEQVEDVRMELKKRNPGFDGSVTHKLEGAVVAQLNINGKNLRDISPVRALPGMKVLSCTGGPLTDLSPLQGLALTSLNLNDCPQVRDLLPLKGMPLTSLSLDMHSARGQIRDLEPLRGMPLTSLALCNSQVRDLEPLKGMPLTTLTLPNCIELEDLHPLKGMKLTSLSIGGIFGGTKVRDLSPLKDMTLTYLNCSDAPVSDLSPLQGMQLEDIRLTPKNITQGLNLLRNMKNLKTIGIDYAHAWPAAEFWARFDKGEFEK